MAARRDLFQAVRWPLLLVGVAVLGIVVAAVLDSTPARDYALVIGAPALTVLLPLGVAWLAVALLVHSRRRARS